jgi:mRNA interferase MazF
MGAKRKIISPNRGEIYLVNFDPTVGAEIQKTRPALIIQNDVSNKHSPITIVAAITSQIDETLYPTEVLLETSSSGLKVPSLVLLNQVRSIDRQRLIKRLGKIAEAQMAQLDRAIQISFGLVEL